VKYVIATVVLFTLIFLHGFLHGASFAKIQTKAQELLPIDAVVIIDVSWSMADADPNRIANYATNVFIDKLNPETDRVGVVAYAGNVTFYHELTTLTEENVLYINNRVNNLPYASWTDHSHAIFKAIELFEETEGRQSIIIFLTDGNLSLNPVGTRTHEEGKRDLNLSIELAQQLGLPVYSIGLNHDGTLDRDFVRSIAETTGGLAFETNSAEDLPEIMASIFAEMIVAQTTSSYLNEDYTAEIADTETIPSPYPHSQPFIQKAEASSERNPWLLIISAALFVISLALIFTGKKKRVFTGKLIIESDTLPPIHKNLVEYGRHTTLATLLKNELPHGFDGIFFSPCPKGPSHLPHLVVKCKNPSIQFKKNFFYENAPIRMNSGTLLVIEHIETKASLRLKYVVT